MSLRPFKLDNYRLTMASKDNNSPSNRASINKRNLDQLAAGLQISSVSISRVLPLSCNNSRSLHKFNNGMILEVGIRILRGSRVVWRVRDR